MNNLYTLNGVHPLDTKFYIRDFAKKSTTRTAIICCSHNGQNSILPTLIAARRQCDVYVYDDASDDLTSGISQKLGLTTVRGEINIGKARGIRRMLDIKFESLGNKRIPDVYDFVMILDDDTILSTRYVQKMEEKFDANKDFVVLEGRLVSAWKPDQNFNGYIAARSVTAWLVHILMTWVQSVLRARTWINGAIAIYRAPVLDNVVRRDPKYITEDNDWCWQIHRNKIGRIKFEYKLTAKLQEPQTFKELYKQHLRWNWGMFQVAREHKVGLRITRPDLMWLFTMILTAQYILLPFYTAATFSYLMEDIKVFLIWFIGRYIVYSMIGAVVSKQWRHIFLWPFFILYDINWRVSVVHGLIKAIKHPVLDVVTWISPTRHIALAEDEVAA